VGVECCGPRHSGRTGSHPILPWKGRQISNVFGQILFSPGAMQADRPPVIQVRLAGMVGQLRTPHLFLLVRIEPKARPGCMPRRHLAILPHIVDKLHGRRAMARKKVYVSSTFKDLEEHRSAVKATLERAGFDVECMEKYPAFDERPEGQMPGGRGRVRLLRADPGMALWVSTRGRQPEKAVHHPSGI
jgi:hypothetical protein